MWNPVEVKLQPNEELESPKDSSTLWETSADISVAVCCSVDTSDFNVVISLELLSTISPSPSICCVWVSTILVTPLSPVSRLACFVVKVWTLDFMASVPFCSFHALPS